jgi:holin-like protein
MLAYVTLIFAFQLFGELVVALTGLPLPGPVVGMVALFAALLIKGAIPDDLARVGDTLLQSFSLLFVPAGVGVMLHVQLIGKEILPIGVALVVSTLLTIAVTAGLMSWLNRARAETDG